MDIIQSVALAGGLAWASGMRLYAVLFTAGLLSRFGYVQLPATLHVLENPLVMGVAGFMLAVEFLADKIPAVDSVWDSIQTFIRIPAGALLAALALGGHDPALMLAAGLLGGTLTAGTHAAKAGSRALINASPEPFSNIAASLGEEALVASGLFTAFQYPVVFLVLLGVFILVLIWLLPKVFRGVRMVFGRLFGKAPG
ncbi:MAG TPA: DUF4126 domain-containing protein [Rhodocyclaceae bacterium]|nr:DUF4126 domain-containing protein [Rhodocyclaceae bacterium]